MIMTNDLNNILGIIMAAAFLVNIIVQMTKGFIPLPTKLWCILVSLSVNMAGLFLAVCVNTIKLNTISILLSVFASFIVAFIAMYGFDTFKDLWQRFKDGENISENN